MKEMRSLHLRVQEMCDCYAETDPLDEMAKMSEAYADAQQAAVKWLALAILHGINSNSEKISLKKNKKGKVSAKTKHPEAKLPAPNGKVADAVMDAMRRITHIEDNGSLPFAVGIRDSNIELLAKLKFYSGSQKLKLKFPKVSDQ